MPDKLKEAILSRVYGKGNINLFTRPISVNPDGSRSTLYSMGIGDEQGEVLIPGVDAHGKGIIPPEDAIKQYEQTGKFLGRFKTPDEASAYGEQLHEDAEAGYYTPSFASSRKDVDSDQLNKALLFLLQGKK